MGRLPKSDVTKMNEYINENQKELEAAGQGTTDLIINLFKGYEKAKDTTFRQWFCSPIRHCSTNRCCQVVEGTSSSSVHDSLQYPGDLSSPY